MQRDDQRCGTCGWNGPLMQQRKETEIERREREIRQLRECLRRIASHSLIDSPLAKSMAQHALNMTARFERIDDAAA